MSSWQMSPKIHKLANELDHGKLLTATKRVANSLIITRTLSGYKIFLKAYDTPAACYKPACSGVFAVSMAALILT